MHTARPWVVGERDPRDNTIAITGSATRPAKRGMIASVSPRPHYANNQEENARLIVAAPDLLHSLEWLLQAARTEPGMDIYKAHLAEAEGYVAQAKGNIPTGSPEDPQG
jgi:hypothetical protein